MLVAAAVLAVLAGAVHVLIFVLEAVLFRRPGVYRRFRTRPADVDAVAPWALNQGFYNLFLALGALVGAWAATARSESVGLALVLLSCGSMLAAALVLVVTDRRLARAAVLQGLFPLLAVAAALAALAA